MSSDRDARASVRVTTVAVVQVPGAEAVPVAADLEYRAGDCWAVRLVLRDTDGGEVCWHFAWELLASGLADSQGDGDVGVRPLSGAADRVEIALRPSAGATLLVPARAVAEFVNRVQVLAPWDVLAARLGLDEELTRITERA